MEMPVQNEGTWLVGSLCGEAALFQLFIKLSAAVSLLASWGWLCHPSFTHVCCRFLSPGPAVFVQHAEDCSMHPIKSCCGVQCGGTSPAVLWDQPPWLASSKVSQDPVPACPVESPGPVYRGRCRLVSQKSLLAPRATENWCLHCCWELSSTWIC